MQVPRHWRLQKQRYTLVGETCPKCHTKFFTPRAVCPHCSSEHRHDTAHENHDTVYALTTARVQEPLISTN
jgi:uncharacterized protein